MLRDKFKINVDVEDKNSREIAKNFEVFYKGKLFHRVQALRVLIFDPEFESEDTCANKEQMESLQDFIKDINKVGIKKENCRKEERENVTLS